MLESVSNNSTRRPLSQMPTKTEQPNRNHNLPQMFKTLWLNTTLKFIKDDSRLILKYPELTSNEMDFVQSLILPDVANISNVGFGFKSMYAPLWEALKIFSLKYEFKVSYNEKPDTWLKSLTVEKIPKNNKNTLDNANTCHNTSLSETESELDSTKEGQKKSLLKNLSYLFIKASLQAILDFLNDDARVTLIFQDKDLNESKFLTGIRSIAKKIPVIFPGDCEKTAMEICKKLKSKQFTLLIVEGKCNKQTRLRDVTFSKEVCFRALKRQIRRERKLLKLKQSHESLDLLDISANNIQDRLNLKKSTPIPMDTGESIPDTSIKPALPLRRHRSLSRTARKPKSIEFQNAGCLDDQPTDNVTTDKSTIDKVIDNVSKLDPSKTPLNRKTKLLKDMLTPVESDKAARMMYQMGWDGGPLGTRGDGITEPIMPALHIVNRVGLGHDRHNVSKQNLANPTSHKTNFLNDILTLINSDVKEMVVIFEKKLSKKQVRFIRKTLASLNSRNNVNMGPDKEIYDRVLEDVRKTPGLNFTVTFLDDHKQIKLVQSIKPMVKAKQTSKQPPTADYDHNIKVEDVIFDDSIMNDCPHHFKTDKSRNGYLFKVTVLQKILKFLTSDSCEIIYSFYFAMAAKQISYLNTVVTAYNKKTMIAHNTLIELHLFKDILKHREYNLELTLGRMNSKILFKKVYIDKNPDTNSADNIDNNIDIDSEQEKEIIHETEKATVEPIAIDEISIKTEMSDVKVNETPPNEIDLSLDDTLASYSDSDIKVETIDLTNNIEELESSMSAADLNDAEDNNNNVDSSVASKRFRSDSDASDRKIFKKSRYNTDYVKNVAIVPKTYPDDVIDMETVRKVQILISECVDNKTFSPLLKCLGLMNGCLVYSCHSEKTVFWLETILSVANVHVKIIEHNDNVVEKHKVCMRINSFIKENFRKIFDRLELYNEGLNTVNWEITDEQTNEENVTIKMVIDDESMAYIKNSWFSLYVGSDLAEFSMIWD